MASAFDPYYEWLGIPPKDQPPNYYRLLGLELFEANADVIDNAAEQRMLLLRNRQAGSRGEITQKLLNEISAARGVLLDAAKKELYDADLRRKQNAQAAASAVRTAAPLAAPLPPPPPVNAPPVAPPRAPTNEFETANAFSVAPARKSGGAASRKLKRSNKNLQFLVAGLGVFVVLLLSGAGYVVARFVIFKPAPEVAAKDPVKDSHLPAPVTPSTTTPTPAPKVPPTATPEMNPPATDPGKKPTTPEKATPPATTPKIPVITAKYRPVDLLARIDPTRDAAAGDWMLTDGVLSSPHEEGAARLILPYAPPAQYVLDLDVERAAGNDSLAVGLVVGGRACYHFFDGHPTSGSLSGLAVQRGKTEITGAPLHKGVVLAPEKKTRLRIMVQADTVTVLVNGQLLHQWQGDPKELSLGANGAAALPDPPNRGLYLATRNTEFHFTRVQLTPVTAPRETQVAETPLPETPEPGTPDPTTPTPTTPMPERMPAKRVAAPPAAALAKAREELNGVFKADLAKARTSADKLAILERMLQLASEESPGTATHYALLEFARELASSMGQLHLAAKAVEELAYAFEIDPLPLRQQSFSAGINVNVPLDVRRANVEMGFQLADDDMARDDYAGAAKVLGDLTEPLRLLRDKELGQALADRRKRGSELYAEYKKVQVFAEKLKTDPADAEANLALGKFLCFAKNDWERGLEHLMKGGNEKLTDLATLDFSTPAETKDQIALADGWYELAAAANLKEKPGLQARAALWYRAAQPQATGLERAKIESRLQELPRVPAGAHSAHFAEPAKAELPPE